MTAFEGFEGVDGISRVIEQGSEALGMTMSRRRLLRLGGSVGVAAMAGLLLKSLPVSAAASNGGYTLTNLNLRSKPSSSGKVLAVMPFGSLVTDFGSSKNGYVQCVYEGTKGWAYGELIISTNPDSWPLMTASGTTIKKARIRSYPMPEAETYSMVPKGQEVMISEKVVDGYRFVAYDGAKGWMLDSSIGDYVDGIHPGERLVTTATVNSRQQPSTSAKILRVVPEGTEVVATGYNENGFANVSFSDGGGGWISMDYLAKI